MQNISNAEKLRRKTFVEKVYISMNELTGKGREEALEDAIHCEQQFFRLKDEYRIGNYDDQFRFSKFAMAKYLGGQKTYVMAEEFSDALFDKSDMKLSARYLFSKLKPDEFTAIELPYKYRQTHEEQGLRMYSKTAVVYPIFRGENWVRIMIYMPLCLEKNDYPAYGQYENKLKGGIDEQAIYQLHAFTELAPREQDIDISESIKKFESKDIDQEFLIRIFKSLLYIKSDGEIDLREERPLREVVTSNPKKARKQILDQRHFPVIHVGWSFEKTPIYQKGEWRTRGHFRWQPYDSKENPKYKLIWIDEHLKQRRVQETLIPQTKE